MARAFVCPAGEDTHTDAERNQPKECNRGSGRGNAMAANELAAAVAEAIRSGVDRIAIKKSLHILRQG